MIIYKITNLIDGKIYIGQSINSFALRYNTTKWWKCKKISPHLKASINKYGYENFSVEILEKNIFNVDKLNEIEEFYIKKFNSLDPVGYNLTSGGLNKILSISSRDKMSKSSPRRKNLNEFYVFKNHKTNQIVFIKNLARFCKDKKLTRSEMSSVHQGLSKRHKWWTVPSTKLTKWKIKSPDGEVFVLHEGEFHPFCDSNGVNGMHLEKAREMAWKGSRGWCLLDKYED